MLRIRHHIPRLFGGHIPSSMLRRLSLPPSTRRLKTSLTPSQLLPIFKNSSNTAPHTSQKRNANSLKHDEDQNSLERFMTHLHATIQLDDLFDIVRKSHDKSWSLYPHHSLLKERVLLSGPTASEVNVALARLRATRRLTTPEDFNFLLSIVSTCLLNTPHDSIGTVQIVQALASLKEFPSSQCGVMEEFLEALEPKISIARSGAVLSPRDMTAVLGILLNCHETWLYDQILGILVGPLALHTLTAPASPALDMTGREMSLLLFSLQAISLSHKNTHAPEIPTLIDCISSWIRASPDCRCMSPSQWSRALCGLSKMNSDSPEALNLLSAITGKMSDCGQESPRSLKLEDVRLRFLFGESKPLPPPVFSPRHLSQAMYGLHFMDSQHRAVSQVMSKLSTLMLLHFSGVFAGMDVARVVYGLKAKSISGTSHLCYVLSRKMGRGKIRLSSLQNIDMVMALRGLERLSSDCNEVRMLVRVLAEAWKARQTCPDASVSLLNEAPFTGQMVSQALFGLQLMDARHSEVQLLLQELVCCMQKGRRSDSDFTSGGSKSIGQELLHLQQSGSNISTYHPKGPSTDSLNMQELCNALYGLRSMSTPGNRGNRLVEELLSIEAGEEEGAGGDRLRDAPQLLDSLLESILDRTERIHQALAHPSCALTDHGDAPSALSADVLRWIRIEPMHFARALYGIRHLGPSCQDMLQDGSSSSDLKKDYTATVVKLLVAVQDALAKHEDPQAPPIPSNHEHHQSNTSIDRHWNQSDKGGGENNCSNSNSLSNPAAWSPLQLHDCLCGLLAVDFTDNDEAKRLLSFLLKMTKSLMQSRRDATHRSEGPLHTDEQLLKLYQSLLYFQGKAFHDPDQHHDPLSSVLSKPLYNELQQVISVAEASITFPPLHQETTPPTCPTPYVYYFTRALKKLLSSLDARAEFNEQNFAYGIFEERHSRKIKAFYNVYLHGFHADIVLVGYYEREDKEEMLMEAGKGVGADVNYYDNQYHSECSGKWRMNSSSNIGDCPAPTPESDFEEFIRQAYSPNDLVVVNVEIDERRDNIMGHKQQVKYRDMYLQRKFNILVDRINVEEAPKRTKVDRLGPVVDSKVERLRPVVDSILDQP